MAKSRNKKNIDNYEDSNKGKNNIVRKITVISILVILTLGFICGGFMFGVTVAVVQGTNEVAMQDIELSKLTTFFYDKDGNELSSVHDSENRVVIRYSEISPYIIKSTMAIEDERFLQHSGIDLKRTASAIINFLIKKDSSYGGSTITQQLVKNVTGDKEKGATRKIREWVRAIQLEKQMSKEQIMESYLNTIYFGNGAHGVQVASQTYFAKNAKDLDIAQSAFISGIIQLPETYNPYRGEENRVKAIERQKTVLKKMHGLKYITDEEYKSASAETLEFKKGIVAETNTQSYFIDAVIEDVINTIMKKNSVSREQALKLIYGNGYKIYTTLDPKVQQSLNEVYKDPKLFPVNSKGIQTQSAMVIMNYESGDVAGLIGGVGAKTGDLSLNRATQTARQPGSSMKPIMVYGPAFEKGTIQGAGTGIDDSYFTAGSWTPQNWYRKFYGYVTVRDALKQSMNIPAVKTLQKVGVDYAYDFAKSLGLSTLVDNDKNLASALGGLTKGVTVMDMTAAYGVYANKGIYVKPRLFTKIVDKNGNEVITNEKVYKQVIKDTTAGMMTDIMTTVVTSGTGTKARINGFAVAGKTGTTNDNKDLWFIGYTPYYVAGIWYGYDQPATLPAGDNHKVAWQRIMANIHKNLKPVSAFEKPKGLVNIQVCRDSGLIATDACIKDTRGSRVISELFIAANVPTENCNVHTSVNICNETGKLATDFCPSVVKKGFITRDPLPKVGTDDQGALLPMEVCNIHTTKVVINTKPVISGASNKSITIGSNFDKLSGISVSDKEDTSLDMSKLTVTGTVNTSQVGVYTLTYSITDSGGLTTTVTREITVSNSGSPGL